MGVMVAATVGVGQMVLNASNFLRTDLVVWAEDTMNVVDMIEAGLVRKGHLVKVLGNGEISVALGVTADAYTASAKSKIEAAGGKAN